MAQCFAKLISSDLLPTPNLFGGGYEYSNVVLEGTYRSCEQPERAAPRCLSIAHLPGKEKAGTVGAFILQKKIQSRCNFVFRNTKKTKCQRFQKIYIYTAVWFLSLLKEAVRRDCKCHGWKIKAVRESKTGGVLKRNLPSEILIMEWKDQKEGCVAKAILPSLRFR